MAKQKYRAAWWALGLVLAALCWLRVETVQARATGLAVTDCTGCHVGGKPTTVSIGFNPTTFQPGQKVRVTVTIQAVNGPKGGVYVTSSEGVGKLALVAGEPMKLAGDNGATHSSPKSSTDGGKTVTFQIDWTAPSTAGSVEFHAYGLSANGDNSDDGDGAGVGYASAVFGCAGMTYYQDNDGDGYGSVDSDPRQACSMPMLYASSHDDCDDSLETTHPGAPELCNMVDDDCDGQVDEGLPVMNYCQDKDGDGHGVNGGTTMMGCAPSKGFGLCDNDCNDADPTIYPTADEQCNYRDDNCNGQIDENARMTCGEGWCRRSSEGCNASLCEPGPPRAEQCNALDDDCDGIVDNGATCPNGAACVNGACGTNVSSAAGDASVRDAGKANDAGKSAASDASVSDVSSSGCGLRGGSSAASLLILLLLLFRRRFATANRP